jgi:alpha-tubulin suppressor-like RCC1 family protein
MTYASLTLMVNQATGLTASGGVLPYSFSISAGGGTINSSTGMYTAPASVGTATVTVTDARGNSSTTSITVVPQLIFTPNTGSLLVSENILLTASGGLGPYSFAVTVGSGNLADAGNSTTFTPAASGNSTVTVTDTIGNTVAANLDVFDNLVIAPSSANINVLNTQLFTATGGIPPLTFSVALGGGTIDAGSGFYTAPAVPDSVTVRVMDSLGHFSDSAVTIIGILSISPGTKTLAVNNTFTFSAVGGAGPYSFAVTSGGGTVDSATGLFTAPGVSGSAAVTATDSLGATSTASITINSALSVTPSAWTLAVNGTKQFSGAGGVSPYTYSVVAGVGTINASGLFTAPGTVGANTVRVTDSLGNTSDANVTVTEALAISPLGSNVLVTNTKAFSAMGGVPPYVFSVSIGGGSIDSGIGLYTAPAAAGEATIQVTDSQNATASTSVSIFETLVINPTTATTQILTMVQFGATGGLGALSYSVATGTGTIDAGTGAYTAPGVAESSTVVVTDTIGNTATATLTILAPLAVTPTTKTLASNNQFTFVASGGTAPYTYQVLNGGGTVTNAGLYTAPSAAGTATVQLTDSLNATVEATVTIISPSKFYAGGTHNCVIFSDGSVKCWGENTSGQLGLGTALNMGDGANEMGDNLPFLNLGTGRTALELALGTAHTCVLLDNSTVKCWGNNAKGQLGIGTTVTYGATTGETPSVATVVPFGAGITPLHIYAGGSTNCIASTTGVLVCWGDNISGQLGIGATNGANKAKGDAAGEVAALTGIALGAGYTLASVQVGALHTCAVLNDTAAGKTQIKCWGESGVGQLLAGSGTVQKSPPASVLNFGGTLNPIALGGNYNHGCAIMNDNTVRCWGENVKGQLGLANVANWGDNVAESSQATATAMGTGRTAVKIATGLAHSCAVLDNGDLKCWGSGLNGQIGLEALTTDNRGDAANEMGDFLSAISFGTGTIAELVVGHNHNCLLLSTNEIRCWGGNSTGALGRGDVLQIGDGAGEMGVGLLDVKLTGM